MSKPALSHIPPWQDTVTLAKNISVSPSTVDNWVSQGILPPPRNRGGKRLWKWEEVDDWLTNGPSGLDAEAERIRNATRQAAESRTGH